MREITGSNDFVKIITMVSEESEDNEEKKTRHKLEAQFIGECLINICGRARAKKWCSNNKGKRFLHMTTESCRAYTKLLLLDKAETYEEEFLLMAGLTQEDLQLYNRFKKKKRGFDKEDRER